MPGSNVFETNIRLHTTISVVTDARKQCDVTDTEIKVTSACLLGICL